MVRRRKDWAFFTVKNVESTHFFVVIFVIAWKESRNRKSLVIEGARQAGKTWMMKGFGRRANRDTVYINFDSNSMMMQLFTSDLNTERFAKLLERQDYSKHAPVKIVPKIRMMWNSILSQLAKENRKFIYGLVRGGKNYETAIMWLCDSGLVHKVSGVNETCRMSRAGEPPGW